LISLTLVAVCALAWAAPADAAPKRKKSPVTSPAPPATPTAPVPAKPRKDDDGAAESGRRGPARIEFDDRLVQGQTNKANAIYLFERRESALRSLLKKRTDFHAEIDEMLDDELVR
jgi:hypothetical protein